ncbi:MAG: hypothetical protein PHH85_07330 [Candidatus Methanoperedens sp.]|nr:hypothetical protein [Candidatus Methanoperedens sp.]
MPTSAVLMRRAGILFIIIILMVQIAGAQSEITNEKSIFKISVFENGSALWSEEKYYPLPSLSAISEWNLSLKDQENNSRGIEIYERINMSLLSAINYSGRPMSIRNFSISYDLEDTSPDAYGVIRLSFEWVNFSRINDSNIIIGDAFSNTIVPSVNNVLIIKPPHGFEAVNASPGIDRRDDKENMLIWDGTIYRSFKIGEPSLVLSRKLTSDDSYPAGIAIISILVGGSILFLFVRWYISKKNLDVDHGLDNKLDQEQVATEGEEEVNLDEDEAVRSDTSSDLPPITEDILGDEDMIERYLIKCGGQAYQSDIVNESGLSKSKISIVLSKMKDEGRIIKIRKGKENVIRMAKKEQGSN